MKPGIYGEGRVARRQNQISRKERQISKNIHNFSVHFEETKNYYD